MTPERWRMVSDLFSAVLQCDPASREAMLQNACGDDRELRAEVDRLLNDDAQAADDDFLNTPFGSRADDSRENPIRKLLAEVNLSAKLAVPPEEKFFDKAWSDADRLLDATHWGLIKSAQAKDTSHAGKALAEIFEIYWYPIYAYIRRKGYASEAARDLTQGFFQGLPEHDVQESVRREKGKFRSFLLTSCRDYLINERAQERAQRRGDGRCVFTIDLTAAEARYAKEPMHILLAERLFDAAGP